MKSVRIDARGELRCWNCGNSEFRRKLTPSGVMLGIFSLFALAPSPAEEKLKCRVCGEFNDNRDPFRLPPPVVTPEPNPSAGASWQLDPTERHEMRYWDGAAWTDHVSDDGITATDPTFG